MKSTRRDVVAAVIVSAALVGAMEGLYRPLGARQRIQDRVARLSKELNLTAEQAAEIEELLREQSEAENAFAAGTADNQAADPRASRRAFRERLAALLTEEQRQQLRRLLAQRRARMQVWDVYGATAR